MKKFNYKKWKNGYSHNLLMEQATGSGTGSGTGSNNPPTGSGTGSNNPTTGSSCVYHQPAAQAVNNAYPNQQVGDHGITQQFVNNMQGKPNAFYQARTSAFTNKLQQLTAPNPSPVGNGNLLFCKGSNPMWQAQLVNRVFYVQNCIQNPGSC